jgi:hypothetical protein
MLLTPPRTLLVFRHLNSEFQTVYVPQQDIPIDVSVILWKGCLFFKQDVQLKLSQVGIKTFELCESDSGCLLSFMVYYIYWKRYSYGALHISKGIL